MTKKKANSDVTEFRVAFARLHLRDQKKLFNGMAPEMKLALWTDRLECAKKETRSIKRKAAIQQYLDQLNIKLYSDSNEKALKKFSTFLEKNENELFSVFGATPEILSTILTRLGDGGKAAPIIASGKKKDCTCSIRFTDHLRGTDCSFLTEDCVKADCEATSFGCGQMWLFSCDGLCEKKKTSKKGKA